MTSKQRAHLRGLANTLDTIFQIGKSVGNKITLYRARKENPKLY